MAGTIDRFGLDVYKALTKKAYRGREDTRRECEDYWCTRTARDDSDLCENHHQLRERNGGKPIG